MLVVHLVEPRGLNERFFDSVVFGGTLCFRDQPEVFCLFVGGLMS